MRRSRVEDDREQLTGSQRVILVVEDDEAFARVIYDLAKENGFQCLIATTAEEALAVAAQHRPSAVVLDVGLPDQSGLSVLDRLKHDSRTRHIPVHVVSGHDYSETALALGAVGYMMKPVKREDLGRALMQLEARLDQRLRRVLIVEDGPVQLDSLRKLLGVQQVETLGAQSAGECLRLLKEATFDCMVLDLSLPDASGYSLLETVEKHSPPSSSRWVIPLRRLISCSSLAILFREEGLEARTLIYGTDIDPTALKKAEAGVYDLDRIPLFTENHRRSGGRSSLSDYYTAAYGAAVFDKSLRQRVVFSDICLTTPPSTPKTKAKSSSQRPLRTRN